MFYFNLLVNFICEIHVPTKFFYIYHRIYKNTTRVLRCSLPPQQYQVPPVRHYTTSTCICYALLVYLPRSVRLPPPIRSVLIVKINYFPATLWKLRTSLASLSITVHVPYISHSSTTIYDTCFVKKDKYR